MKAVKPLYQELNHCHLPDLLGYFENDPFIVLLDSAQYHQLLGRYSFLGISPFANITAQDHKLYYNGECIDTDLFQLLKETLSSFPLQKHDHLPPFQGGLMGYLGYDLAQYLEEQSRCAVKDIELPDFECGLFDLVVAQDHLMSKTYVFSSGFPETNHVAQQSRAQKRLNWFLETIAQDKPRLNSYQPIPIEAIKSNFDRPHYVQAVEKAKTYIRQGDIFEVNISQRFEVSQFNTATALDFYHRLRHFNPAPFAAFIKTPHLSCFSASPERFVQCENGQVEARPIKGTISRGISKSEDIANAKWLQQSEKDRAENIMIVDLMRNDLSKVSEPHSVQVTKLCGLESFRSVHHLVSEVRSQLKPNHDVIDLIQATFPGGSITGAPKIRAIDIIDELESVRRGLYCGSIGYIGFDGSMDLSIVIRTLVAKQDKLVFSAGGAVTIDSDPLSEYEETLAKAAAIIQSLTSRD